MARARTAAEQDAWCGHCGFGYETQQHRDRCNGMAERRARAQRTTARKLSGEAGDRAARRQPALAYTVHRRRVVIEDEQLEVVVTPEIREAMRCWLANECYLIAGGNYRIKAPRINGIRCGRARAASWNAAVRAAFPDNDAFHRAARTAREQGLL